MGISKVRFIFIATDCRLVLSNLVVNFSSCSSPQRLLVKMYRTSSSNVVIGWTKSLEFLILYSSKFFLAKCLMILYDGGWLRRKKERLTFLRRQPMKCSLFRNLLAWMFNVRSEKLKFDELAFTLLLTKLRIISQRICSVNWRTT